MPDPTAAQDRGVEWIVERQCECLEPLLRDALAHSELALSMATACSVPHEYRRRETSADTPCDPVWDPAHHDSAPARPVTSWDPTDRDRAPTRPS